MGQAKNRGTYEQRVAQAQQREADRIAAAKAAEDERVRMLVKAGEDQDVARRMVRSGGRTLLGGRRRLSTLALAAILGSVPSQSIDGGTGGSGESSTYSSETACVRK